MLDRKQGVGKTKKRFFRGVIDRNNYFWIKTEFGEFFIFLDNYLQDKGHIFSQFFEGRKNTVVKSVLIKRGKRNRMFLHVSAMSVLTIGVIISPYLQDSNPFSSKKTASIYAQGNNTETNYLASEDVFNTNASQKPRDKIINYTVQKGDTISTIAKKFGISEETIKWENDLSTDSLTTGDSLRILPVTGIAHKVQSGDTVYSIAKKYGIDPQPIVDFPFNDFANPQTFSLVIGEILIVPDGVKPEEQPRYVRPKRTYIATAPANVSGGGFAWPLQGSLNQGFSWYHPGIDIGAPIGTPIVAATNGTVSVAYSSGWNWGYGIHVIVTGDNGYTSLYAHMSGINVSSGDRVSAGKTVIGWVGVTGRTTGPHVHFELRNGGNVNPLSFLP